MDRERGKGGGRGREREKEREYCYLFKLYFMRCNMCQVVKSKLHSMDFLRYVQSNW